VLVASHGSGIQRTLGAGFWKSVGKANPGGMTPTTWNGRLLISMERPTMPGSPP
jgi:hypothetical protein